VALVAGHDTPESQGLSIMLRDRKPLPCSKKYGFILLQ